MTTIERPSGGDVDSGPQSTRSPSVALWLRAALAFVVLLGVFFRFYNLDHKVFWEDEILGAIHALGYTEAEIVAASPTLTNAAAVQHYLEPNAALGVAQTIESLAAEDPQHAPAYYVVVHLWTRVFGGSIEAMRTPAAIFGVLALPCVYWLALELFGSWATALIAVALVAVSPFFVLYSQEAREYSMWTIALALDAVVFLRAIRLGSALLWIAYGAITAAALYIYPLTGLIALGLAVYLFIRERGRITRAMAACILADLAALALFAPWLKIMMTSTGLERGMATILTSKLSAAEIARIFARDLRFLYFDMGQLHAGPLGSSAIDALFTLITVALCAYAFVTLIRRTAFSVWGLIVVGLCLSVVPLVLRDLFVGGHFVYQSRYFTPLLLGTQLAVAALFGTALLGRGLRRSARTVWSVCLVVILSGEVISCAVASQARTWWNKDDERAPQVAALIDAAKNPVVISDYFSPSILELSLYLDPAVPMRLNLECAQCALPHANAAFDTTGYQTVYALQAMRPASDSGYRWVDPVPFPPRSRPLDMFTAISTAR